MLCCVHDCEIGAVDVCVYVCLCVCMCECVCVVCVLVGVCVLVCPRAYVLSKVCVRLCEMLRPRESTRVSASSEGVSKVSPWKNI